MISLMKRSSAVKAVLVNSLAFAFCHMLNPGLTILAFLNLLLIGIFLSLYVIKQMTSGVRQATIVCGILCREPSMESLSAEPT